RLGKKALEPSLTSFARVRDEVSKQRRGHTEALTRSAHPVRPETFVRRQVSWLTARSRPPPSRTTPVAKWRSLAAYSCGGSSGFARLAPLTGFPLRRSSRTVALTLYVVVPCSGLSRYCDPANQKSIRTPLAMRRSWPTAPASSRDGFFVSQALHGGGAGAVLDAKVPRSTRASDS